MELTERETKVLAGLAQGLCIEEIAFRMGLSQRTISYAISAVKQRLNNPKMNLRSLIARSSVAAGIMIFDWHLSRTGQLVQTVSQVVRAKFGLPSEV